MEVSPFIAWAFSCSGWKGRTVSTFLHRSCSPALSHSKMVALHSTCSNMPTFYLYWRAPNWTLYSRWTCWDRLAMLLPIRPRMLSGFFAVKAHSCFVSRLSSAMTSRSFSAELLSTQSDPSLWVWKSSKFSVHFIAYQACSSWMCW